MPHEMMRFIAALLLTLLSVKAQSVERVIHYHNDALGSPIAATDEQGRVVWRKSYAPYGQPIDRAAPNEPGYTGKFEEPDLGIQNFGARWYDPRIGRFLAIDPAGFDPQNPQSFNRYAYANSNPYRFVDPNGESPVDVGFFIVDTVSFGLAVGSGNPAAIQSAGFDFAASAVGLASPIPGTGLAIKAARAADKVGDAARVGTGGQTFDRVVSHAELEATQTTGLLRGGREGENFFTNTASLDAKRAHQRLGLDGPLRDTRIRFTIKNGVDISGSRSAKPGQSGTLGNGREFSTNGPTEIDILRADPLRK